MRAFAALLLVLSVAGIEPAAATNYPEAESFEASADAAKQVDDALTQAKASGKKVLLVMGANWCHDSRALAGWLETPRLAELVAQKYELVLVDVGMPQTGDGQNLDIAERFGIEIEGTPAVLILSPEGELLNRSKAKKWRNAASRSENDIYKELAKAAG